MVEEYGLMPESLKAISKVEKKVLDKWFHVFTK